MRKNIDCLLVTGSSTCGWVRGTVLDGYSYGYRSLWSGMRFRSRPHLGHLVNLFEMTAEYATVIQLAEAMNYVNGSRKLEGRQAVAG